MGLLFIKYFLINNQFKFNKQEKLKSRTLIDHLFSKGKSVSAFPIKALFDVLENATEPLQAGVTVSSRKFKKAVERNRVKRILREAYRLQKLPLTQYLKERDSSLVVFFIYTGKELPIFEEVYGKMGIALQKIQNEILKTDQS